MQNVFYSTKLNICCSKYRINKLLDSCFMWKNSYFGKYHMHNCRRVYLFSIYLRLCDILYLPYNWHVLHGCKATLIFFVCSVLQLFCSVVAGLLHYFFLAAFAWMCIEGIHLYLIVVGVIYNKGFLHRNFYIFGYGSPAVVVAISAPLGYKYYGTSTV